jgi:predicted PurR-regulated permease PerM
MRKGEEPPASPTVELTPGEKADRDGGGLDTEREVAQGERSALRWTAIAAVLAIMWIVMPVGLGILLGTLLAFMVQPLFERLAPRLGARGSAVATVAVTAVGLVGVVGGLASLFVARGTVLTRDLIASLGPGAEGGGVLDAIGRYTVKIGIPPEELTARARSLAAAAAGRAEGLAETLVSTTAGGMLALFFAMLSLHFILRNWKAVARRAQETFPLRPDYTAELLTEFRRVGRTTLLGTIITGIAQGVFATLGYWICGLREPVFFGVATALASLIPAVGTMLVWVPLGIYLIADGHVGRGVLELVWGSFLIIGVPDYVIRPRLVGEEEIPSLVTFAALFGGVEVFGLKGLIVGPVVMAVSIAVLRLYASEARKRRASAQYGPPPSSAASR